MAMQTADRLDGRPEGAEEPAIKRSKAGSGRKAPTHPVATKTGNNYCYAWNDGSKCPEPCPQGRKHACRWCGKGHRGITCPEAPAGKGKGSGKNDNTYGGGAAEGGSKKKSRKNKSGKGSGKGSSK